MTQQLSGMILADVDFYIKGLFKYNLFGQELWFTTTHVGLIIVTIVLLVLMIVGHHKIVRAKPEDKPKGLQNVLEMAVSAVDNMVAGIMGEKGRGFRNWICAVAMFILFCNVSGLFGLRPPTADYGVTLPLGLITFALIQINGLRAKKIHHITSLFQPSPVLFPINLIGEIASVRKHYVRNNSYGAFVWTATCGIKSRNSGSNTCILRYFFGSDTDICILYAYNGLY